MLAVLLGGLSMVSPFSIDTLFPAFHAMEKALGVNALQLQQIGTPGVAALERGALVAIMLKPVGKLSLLALMLRGAFGQLGDADSVVSFGFTRLVVQPAGPLRTRRIKVATDGEVFFLRAPLVFNVWPEPLMLLKPAPADDAGDAASGAHANVQVAASETARPNIPTR